MNANARPIAAPAAITTLAFRSSWRTRSNTPLATFTPGSAPSTPGGGDRSGSTSGMLLKLENSSIATLFSSRSSASMDCGRCSGSFAIARMISISSCAGTSLRTDDSGAGMLFAFL
jgi:hypothetical protein